MQRSIQELARGLEAAVPAAAEGGEGRDPLWARPPVSHTLRHGAYNPRAEDAIQSLTESGYRTMGEQSTFGAERVWLGRARTQSVYTGMDRSVQDFASNYGLGVGRSFAWHRSPAVAAQQ